MTHVSKSACLLALCAFSAAAQNTDWPAYLGGQDSAHYSPLTQITPENVANMELAWTYASEGGDATKLGQIQCNPLVIGGVLYGVSPWMKVFALDAATGAEQWAFTPEGRQKSVCRGLAWWTDGTEKRILFAAGSHLYAIDATTGKGIESFGTGGKVDLSLGLGYDGKDLPVVATTPGVVYKDLYILGFRTNEALPSTPGHIRAFNVRTGAIAWVFHTIPQPGEAGYETWPTEAYTYTGGANSWAGMSLDAERGIVYVPTGSAAFDFYGGDRHGDNLFANSLLALDAATGERKWHFQSVHHDLWDRDLPAPPNLMTVMHDGKKIDAVAQITKSAYVFLFNRDTGEPLFPIEEVAVPPSDLIGELAAKTQPIPTKPPRFARSRIPVEEVTNITPASRDYAIKRWSAIKKSPFSPPSREGTLVFPGFDGGGEWGGAATDPESGILYVNNSEMPWIHQMVDLNQLGGDAALQEGAMLYAQQCLFCHGVNRQGNPLSMVPALTGIATRTARDVAEGITQTGKGFMPSFKHIEPDKMKALLDYLYKADEAAAPSAQAAQRAETLKPQYQFTGYNRFVDPLGYPAITPPWGSLNAIDMNTGEILWKVVLGDTPELKHLRHEPTGAENYGGPVITKGGVLFIAATKDEMFRAFDKKTGALLWETKLPAGGYATPSVYEVGGTQYVVIAAGGGKIGTPEGDQFLAYRIKK